MSRTFRDKWKFRRTYLDSQGSSSSKAAPTFHEIALEGSGACYALFDTFLYRFAARQMTMKAGVALMTASQYVLSPDRLQRPQLSIMHLKLRLENPWLEMDRIRVASLTTWGLNALRNTSQTTGSLNPNANYDLRDPVPGAFIARPPVCLHRSHSYLAAL